ncbi:MAG: Hsp20 family protein [Bacteroidota bacterium]
MKKSKYLDLVTSVDVLNTLNGGTSEPQVILKEDENGREICLRVPGVSREMMHVEVHNNNLTVYYFLNIESSDMMIQLPKIVYNRTLPYFVDISKISAHFDENQLIVELPFNRLANGYHKQITIGN